MFKWFWTMFSLGAPAFSPSRVHNVQFVVVVVEVLHEKLFTVYYDLYRLPK